MSSAVLERAKVLPAGEPAGEPVFRARGLSKIYRMGEVGVRPGDPLTVEVLEWARPVRRVVVAGVADEMIGMSAYLELGGLNRLMREGETVSGAYLAVDQDLSEIL